MAERSLTFIAMVAAGVVISTLLPLSMAKSLNIDQSVAKRSVIGTTETLTLTDINIFTRDRLQLTLNVSFDVVLNLYQFPLLHEDFINMFKLILKVHAMDAIKTEAISYTVREYYELEQRTQIESVLREAVRSRLLTLCCVIDDCNPGSPCEATYCRIPNWECTSDDVAVTASLSSFSLTSVGFDSFLLAYLQRG